MRYPQTIADAAKLLDKHVPNWFKTINLPNLDMTDAHNCILGQLYDHYDDAMDYLFPTTRISNHCQDKIFGRNAPKSDWQKEINTRLSRNCKIIYVVSLKTNNNIIYYSSLEAVKRDYGLLYQQYCQVTEHELVI